MNDIENNLPSDADFASKPSKSLAMIGTRTVVGVQALAVVVEVHLANGLPAFATVGLPEAVVRESKDRVRGAIINSGFEFPAKRITVNLAPADLPKTGGRFDLPIAIGILIASGQLPIKHCDQYEMIGELALDGRLRQIAGVLPTALACGISNKQLIVPSENANEAALAQDTNCWHANHLLDVCKHLMGQTEMDFAKIKSDKINRPSYADISDVKGQQQAKRALEIAASGNHSVLFIGPPGTGKSMLASRLPGILPELSNQDALEVAAIQSIAQGQFDLEFWKERPFRSPHHSASAVALVGGGSNPRPGEISLAHKGILFLDEFTEFTRSAIEQLREPLETGSINIARAAQTVRYPADFLMIAACNPCKCGLLGDGTDRCQCSAVSIENYRTKISGPMLDRIDMHVYLQRVDLKVLQTKNTDDERSQTIKQRVSSVRTLQSDRQGKVNSQLSVKEIDQHCDLDSQLLEFLQTLCEKLNMSARAYHHILKLARTIADMSGEERINKKHLSEAISFRALDRR